MLFSAAEGHIIASQNLEIVPSIKLCYSISCIMILSCNKCLKYFNKYIIVVNNVHSLFKRKYSKR